MDNSTEKRQISRDSLIAHAPVLSPEEFLDFTEVEDGFELQLVASEPNIITPVSMIFDRHNRIWAVEMTNFMPDMEGNGEQIKDGKVVILEDKDGDGYYEHRKVFLDSLSLPRSIAFVEDGILVVEPPKLWYYQIKEDQPVSKTLVDSAYNEGNNLEAQTNGLYRGIDNWIYNAGNTSSKRYKKKGEEWIVERTGIRGQWGITQDDDGRLFYNNNSQNLLGDYFLPSLGSNNPDYGTVHGFNQRIVKDNRTYPSRPTPGVNRGYLSSEIDSATKKLLKFTAACGPLIYRSDLFDETYYQNAFVAEPAGNLIKRNILEFEPNRVTGEQAYVDSEFIRSDDERFRPVNLSTGPDGAMYIVDMYRGIIQHKLFLTKYLKEEIRERDLEQPVNCGRIYRVVPKGFTEPKIGLSDDPKELVKLLKSKNSWDRETAQRILVDTKATEVADLLKKQLKDPENFYEFIHSLWTLKGLHAISNEELTEQILEEKEDRKLRQLFTALNANDSLEGNLTKDLFDRSLELVPDSVIAPYLALRMDFFKKKDAKRAKELSWALLEKYPRSETIADALISNASGQEVSFLTQVKNGKIGSQDLVIIDKLEKLTEKLLHPEEPGKEALLARKYGRGIGLFRTTCQACHGSDGKGVPHLAPPLSGSEWVQGDKEHLISIVLYGLTGPVKVGNKTYSGSDVSGEMPAAINNPQMVDADLALLLSYIRKNWENDADEVSLEEIKAVKEKWRGREKPFTIKELLGEK